MKIHLVAGARPNFMKIAPLHKALSGRPDRFTPVFVHTGQHYDAAMSDAFLRDLGLPDPDISLGVGSGSHAVQTSKIMTAYEQAVLKDRPDLVMVVGDVNSTIACALVATKLVIPVAHVEAGLRSFDRAMPEEINRVLTDHLSDLLFTTCEDGNVNLKKEGIPDSKIHLVGNMMIESIIQCMPRIEASDAVSRLGLKPGEYGLLTLHRPSNVDDEAMLKEILGAVMEISKRIPVVFPAHPRTQKQMKTFGIDPSSTSGGLRVTEPMGYLDFLALQKTARLVLTDSGGVQEETTFFGVPCLTLRENTERPITVAEGTNRLVPLNHQAIREAAEEALDGKSRPGRVPALWDDGVAGRIVTVLDRCAPTDSARLHGTH
jgi:UDP-N-acetylglucosamine 2-epimerase (non-hydrolysing)